MHRFYLPPEEWNAEALALTSAEAHHARDVLRLGPGKRVLLFNGRGREVTAEITGVSSSAVQLRKLHEAEIPPLRCRITLGQAIPKGKNMELIVQKAVEIGAAEIAPLLSERTVVRLSNDEASAKRAKWQQVAIEAAKQCGQAWLPVVQQPGTVAEFFADPEAAGLRRSGGPIQQGCPTGFDLQLIGSLQPDAQHLKRILAEYEREHGARAASVLMLIGPEGDFTPAELNLARSNGCRPITLGPIILRVETAAIYCLSVLSYELLTGESKRTREG
jgi:16S rRNA (uracil1498-N3)-methyltransferase